MKNKFKYITLFSIVIPSLLVGCSSNDVYLTAKDNGTATIKIFKSENSTTKNRYIAPKNVTMMHSYNSLSGWLSNTENVCPSVGDVNLLVIPVHIPGATANTEKVKNDIEKVFFSEGDESLSYSSVKEYYKESSFGKLNFSGEVTDWFDVAKYTNVKSVSDITTGSTGTIITEIFEKAVAWAKDSQNIDLSKYDYNEDGSIDGVWLVYDHLDMSTEYAVEYEKDKNFDSSTINQAFWNFTSWDWNTGRNTVEGKDPTTSGFSWASYDMMYTPQAEYNKNNVPDIEAEGLKLDSHTFLHETGHLLGLDDYYASDDSYYHPAGCSTMMDQNICDLDSYSKMILGWVTPYVVYGSSEIVIPTATSSDHSVIVIPTNYEEISEYVESEIAHGTKANEITYTFNPFSEYIMVDLYSPDGLNKKDVYGPLINDREAGIANTGVRIYHIDSRIFKCTVTNYDGGTKLTYVDDYVWDNDPYLIEDNQALLMAITNQKTEASNFQLPTNFNYFDQIRLLEATGFNTFSSKSQTTGKMNYASKDTLFTTDSDAFDVISFGYQFFNGNYTYNNGNDLPFKVAVSTLKEIA